MVFSLNTNGSNYVTLHNFSPVLLNNDTSIYTNSDGIEPATSGVILSGNTLYGTAQVGGIFGYGTVFSLNSNGSNFLTLHNFGLGPSGNVTGPYTNNDGLEPQSTLLLSGNTLYGTASEGGTYGTGTVFAMSTNGSSFTVLHTFGALVLNTNTSTLTNDGYAPQGAALILYGNTLYGTTSAGGTNDAGTVFSLNINGSNYMVLHSFSYYGADGGYPSCGLSLSGNTLYGAAFSGGTNGFGTVFSLSTNGSDFTVLYAFQTFYDGDHPEGLMLSGNTLYGTTHDGSTNSYGMVYSLTVTVPVSPPQLAIARSGTNVILDWPTNATGFTLESTTNLVSPAIWITNASLPVVVGTNNAVTNGISGTWKFYRLIGQ